jgi:hypothetical protein
MFFSFCLKNKIDRESNKPGKIFDGSSNVLNKKKHENRVTCARPDPARA